MEIIDATDTILGRLSSYVAKKALDGEEVIIVNAESAVISGNKENIFKEYKEKKDRGERYNGPFYPRMPDRIIKRTIRGMLPYKKSTGRNALKRVKVFLGVPKEYEGKEMKSIEKIKKDKLKLMKYVYLKDISHYLGYKKI